VDRGSASIGGPGPGWFDQGGGDAVVRYRFVAFRDEPAWSIPLLERTVRSSDPSFGKRRRSHVTTGTIKKVVSDRGFGFITADDAKEYFFHRNSLEASLDFDRLAGGEKVQFEIEQSPKGPRAARVQALTSASV
jgi:CspA family cold shock protein